MKKKHSREKFIAFKLFVSIIYLIIITILFVCSYRLFQEKSRDKEGKLNKKEVETYYTACNFIFKHFDFSWNNPNPTNSHFSFSVNN